MGDKTGIEWTDATWNPVTGCTKVSAGCKHCYAERLFPKVYPGRKFSDVRCHEDRLGQPLRWRKPRMVFVNSMSDLFHEAIPDEFLDRIFAVMALCPQHTFQVLTKRPERAREYLKKAVVRVYAEGWLGKDTPINRGAVSVTGNPCAAGIVVDQGWPLPNVWGLVSVEDQATADERIPVLLDTPWAVRGVSYEPAIGPIQIVHWLGGQAHKCRCGWHDTELDLSPQGAVNTDWYCAACGEYTQDFDALDWIICGGESGPGARPMEEAWARSVKEQCEAAGVPFFFKQGSKDNWPGYKNFEAFPKDLQIREYPNAAR